MTTWREGATFGGTHRLWSPRLSRLQGHEHGVVGQGHEELVGVHLRAVLLTGQGQRHRRQGQQQSLAHLQRGFTQSFNILQRRFSVVYDNIILVGNPVV